MGFQPNAFQGTGEASEPQNVIRGLCDVFGGVSDGIGSGLQFQSGGLAGSVGQGLDNEPPNPAL